jgi:hypothetical protein
MKLYAIQGDIPIFKINKLPDGVIKKNTQILIEGESTGNYHRLVDGDVYELGDRLFIQTYQPTIIDHPEHAEIPLEMPGVYEIKRQREYSGENMTRVVID